MAKFLILLCSALTVLTSCNGQVKTNSIDTIETKTLKKERFQKSGSAVKDNDGNIWFIGEKGEGLYAYNPSSKEYTSYTVKDGLSFDIILTVYKDKEGKIWVGTADGITCYDGKNFSVIPITKITGDPNYQPTKRHPQFGFPQPEKNWVVSIMQDKKGIFWFGTHTGIYRYDGKSYSHFTHNDGVANSTGVSINLVESILEDSSGKIWFGGRGTNGVFCYDGNILINYQPNATEWAFAIYQDKQGDIWFSSRCACLYRKSGDTFSLFKSPSFNDFVFDMTQDNSGNYLFGNTIYDGKTFSQINDQYSRQTLLNANGENLWFKTKDNKLSKYDGKDFITLTKKE